MLPVEYPFHPHCLRRRAAKAVLTIALALSTVGASFFKTQILNHGDFALRAEDNQFRPIPIPAPRGAIRDRNGTLLAETLMRHAVLLEPAPPDSLRARLSRLTPVLNMDSATAEQVLAIARRESNQPVLVSATPSFDQVSYLEEHRSKYRGLLLEPRPTRRYPHGPALAHLLGYVGEISRTELDDTAWAGYPMGSNVGKTGLERFHERRLGGVPGKRYVEVDARGKMVGRFAAQHFVQPQPGEDLRLTIDLPLQRFVHQTFPQDRRGAVVVMSPRTGEVLALYSHPTFDPNLLIGRISQATWSQLVDNPGQPLRDRAAHGKYPPGSTWKLATAIVGLERGVITPSMRMPIACTGGFTFAGRYSRCWEKEGHGYQDLLGAIQHSCNVYFYQLGIRLGLDALAREGTRFGFARPTGIDLPREPSGTFPRDRAWYRERFKRRAAPSEVMSLSIGQGPNAQTPLRMAQFFAALAGDGKVPAPRLLLDEPLGPPETDLRASPATLNALREGMARVTGPGGSAAKAALWRWKLAGKTGTSQNSQDARRAHAWFAGYAGPPGQAPEVVVAVVVEFGESGAEAAAPVAARVANFYLNRQHGFPVPALATR